MDYNEKIKNLLDTLPNKPGCYIMKGDEDRVIYVGKAINLRNRVRSYFHTSSQLLPRIEKMVQKIQDIEWIVVDSELEALILEMNLIKKYRPHYNIRLKDDKRYPYIKVHWADSYPKVTVTREMTQDGSRYFGPYTSVWAVHQTMDILRRIFPYLTCDRVITGHDERACLYYDIKLCAGPCIGAISEKDYRQLITDLGSFLQGHTEQIVRRIQKDMELEAEKLNFERAALMRDQLRAISSVVEKQKVISSDYIDSDVIAMARSKHDACVQVFFVRGGKLIGREYFLLDGTEEEPDATIISQFIKQYYDKNPVIPAQVLLPHEIEEVQIIQQWLKHKSGFEKVEIVIPKQGQQRELIMLAAENAIETLTSLQAQWQQDKHRQEQALGELQNALNLSQPPNRIECYDISNIQGTSSVGSMVVFEQGVAKKNLYRQFIIRSVQGADDFASMEEVLQRRFNRWNIAKESEQIPGKKIDQSFSRLPDLIIIDGGKGQLNRACKVLEHYDLQEEVPIVGLAKQNEELYIPGIAEPLILPRQSQGLYLIQRIRDEAHRFAITHHRKIRTKKGLASRLDTIPGIGVARRKKLLESFGSIHDIQEATIDELAAVPGITTKLAEVIKSNLD